MKDPVANIYEELVSTLSEVNFVLDQWRPESPVDAVLLRGHGEESMPRGDGSFRSKQMTIESRATSDYEAKRVSNLVYDAIIYRNMFDLPAVVDEYEVLYDSVSIINIVPVSGPVFASEDYSKVISQVAIYYYNEVVL